MASSNLLLLYTHDTHTGDLHTHTHTQQQQPRCRPRKIKVNWSTASDWHDTTPFVLLPFHNVKWRDNRQIQTCLCRLISSAVDDTLSSRGHTTTNKTRHTIFSKSKNAATHTHTHHHWAQVSTLNWWCLLCSVVEREEKSIFQLFYSPTPSLITLCAAGDCVCVHFTWLPSCSQIRPQRALPAAKTCTTFWKSIHSGGVCFFYPFQIERASCNNNIKERGSN